MVADHRGAIEISVKWSMAWFVGRCEAPRDVRLRVRTNRGVEVPIGQQHWPVRSGRQLRRREAGGGAAGSEIQVHKQNPVELDSARHRGEPASLMGSQERKPPREGSPENPPTGTWPAQ